MSDIDADFESISMDEFRLDIYVIELEYFHSFGEIALCAARHGVLVQDVPAHWAGRVRFVGYMTELVEVISANWGETPEFLLNPDGSQAFETWVAYIMTEGKKL